MRILVAALAAVLASPLSVLASPCGDDVEGLRVACRCGDTVVSDTRIRADDPVVTERCSLDGLLVRAGEYAESITLDLGGHEIRGSGAGFGVRVVHGGTDGAHLVGASSGKRGAIVGFGIGLATVKTDGLARIAHLELRGNTDEGARLAIAGTVLEDVVAEGNGRDGFSVRGSGGRFAGVEATGNGENGLRLFADNAAVNVTANGNARSGIIVDGMDNELEGAEAVGNGRDGVVARGSGGNWEVLRSEGNGRDDLRANGRVPDKAESPR